MSVHSLAPIGTLCQGNTPRQASFTCKGDNDGPCSAVHTWEGRNYCGYHSPFTVTEDERAALKDRETTPEQGNDTEETIPQQEDTFFIQASDNDTTYAVLNQEWRVLGTFSSLAEAHWFITTYSHTYTSKNAHWTF